MCIKIPPSHAQPLTRTNVHTKLERDTPWHSGDESSPGYYSKSFNGAAEDQVSKEEWIYTLMSMQEAFAFYKFRRLHERNPKELRSLLVTWVEQTLIRHVADVLHELTLSFVNGRLDKQEARLALSAPLLSLPPLAPVRSIEPNTHYNYAFLAQTVSCSRDQDADALSADEDGDTESADDDGDTEPADEDGDTEPADEDGDTELADEDGDTESADEDGDTELADEDGGTESADEDGDTEPADEDASALLANDDVKGLANIEDTGMLDLLLAEQFLVKAPNPSSQQSSIRSTYAWERRYLCTHLQRQPHFGANDFDQTCSRSGPHTLDLSGANLCSLSALQLFGLDEMDTSHAAAESSETKSDQDLLDRANASSVTGPDMHTSNAAVGLADTHRAEVTKIDLQWNHLRSLQQLCVAPLSRDALNQSGTSVEVIDIGTGIYFPAKLARPPRDAPEIKPNSDMVYVRLDQEPETVVLRQITHLRQDMLTKLEVIHAPHNHLRFLCEDPLSLPLDHLHYMQQLRRRIAGNTLEGALPESSIGLEQLQQQLWNTFPKPMMNLLVLDISHNQLTHVPDLRSMPALQVLRLSHNAIEASSVNDSLAEAHALVEIRLDHNNLLWMDEQSMIDGLHVLKKLSCLRTLDLRSNPFESEVGVREEYQWCAWLLKLQPRLEVLNSKPSLATKARTHLLLHKPIVSFQTFGELLDRAVQVPFTAAVNLAQFRDNAETMAESVRLGPKACGIVRHMFSVMDGTRDEVLAHGFIQQVKMAVHKLPIPTLQPLAEAIALFSASLPRGTWGGLGDKAFDLLLEFLRRRQSETERAYELRSSALAAVKAVFCERLKREFEAEHAHSLHRLYREQTCANSTQLADAAAKGTNVLRLKANILLDIGDKIVLNEGQKHEQFAIVANIDPLELEEPLKRNHSIGEAVRNVTGTRYFSANADERTIDTEFHTFVRLCYRKRHALARQVAQRNLAARLTELALASGDAQTAAAEIASKICIHARLELCSDVDQENSKQRQQPADEVAQSHLLRRLSSETSMPHMQDPLPWTFSSGDVRSVRYCTNPNPNTNLKIVCGGCMDEYDSHPGLLRHPFILARDT